MEREDEIRYNPKERARSDTCLLPPKLNNAFTISFSIFKILQ